MAGHSKWANIKFRKAGQDAKRGKMFTKFIREITVAARTGGSDLSSNPRLRTAVDKALSGNMTRDVIDRAIKRGAGGEEGQDLEEVRYEGYGPGGVAIMLACLTNNKNRTVSEIRHALVKQGGNLGTDGSVSYLFSKQGQIILPAGVSEEAVMEVVLEAGAEDIKTQEDGSIEVMTNANVADFLAVKQSLKKSNLEFVYAEITMIPSTEVELDVEGSEKLLKLIDMLEDLDDVQNVYHNAVLSD